MGTGKLIAIAVAGTALSSGPDLRAAEVGTEPETGGERTEEAPVAAPGEYLLARRVERLSADPFVLALDLFDRDGGLRERCAAARRDYRAALGDARDALASELRAAWAPRVRNLLNEEHRFAFDAVERLCVAYHAEVETIRARPAAVIADVTGEPRPGGYASDRLRVVLELPGLSDEKREELEDLLSAQRTAVLRDAHEQALAGKEPPSMRDRDAWSAYRDRRRRLRRELARERYDRHATELKGHLTDAQAEALTRITDAFERRRADLAARRGQLAADLAAALGAEAMSATATRLKDAYGEHFDSLSERPAENGDLWARIYASRTPFAVASTYFPLDEEREEALSRLRNDYAVERRAGRARLLVEIGDAYMQDLLGLLAEGDSEPFRATLAVVRAYHRARAAADETYREAAAAAGLRSTFPPHKAVWLAYRIVGDDEVLRSRIGEIRKRSGRERSRELGRKLKERGVDRESPDYPSVSAEINAAVTARHEERVLAAVRELLTPEQAATLDAVLPAYRTVESERHRLAVAAGTELVELLGAERLLER